MANTPSKSMANNRQHLAGAAPELLFQALDGVPTALYIKDRKHHLIFINKACGQLLGRSPETLDQLTEADIFSEQVAQRLQAVDDDWWRRNHEPIQPSIVTIQATAATGGTVNRQPQRSEDGQFLICHLQPVTSATDGAFDRHLKDPWEMPQLQALLASVPAVIYQLHRSSDGQIQFGFVSPGAYEVFGITSNDILIDAEPILALIHPLDRPRLDQTLAESAETLSPWLWEGRYYKADGKVGWLQAIARPQILASKELAWNGLMMDVTGRKQAEVAAIEQAVMEQAIADNEARFRTITETIPGVLMQLRVLDSGYAIDFVSDRIQALTGLTPADLMADGQTLLDRIHPLDCQRFRETLNAAAQTRSAWQFEGRIISLAGEIRWCHLEAMPISQESSDIGFCGVLLDVSDRKEMEAAYRENDRQLRMALKVSGTGVWTWDMATNQMAWTTEPGTLFESSAVSFCDTFDAYLQNVHPSDRSQLKQIVSQAINTGGEYQTQYRLLLGDSTVRWVEDRGGLWHNSDGLMLGLMGTVVDITDSMLAEAALKESEERNRTLINNIPGAVYRCRADQDWTLVFQSDAIAEITGYPVDYSVTQVNWRLIHPGDRDRLDQEIADAIFQHRSFEVEYRLKHADGSTRWVLETGHPITDATGTVQFIDGVLTDITRRKESEKRLQELARRQGLINRISTQIRDSLELMPLLQTTVQTVRSQLITDRVVVYRFKPDWTGEVIIEDVEPIWQSTLGLIGMDNCFPTGLAEHYASGRIRAINDIHQAGLDECHVQYLEGLQVRANLIVPILLKKQLWGLLIAHECRSPRHWTDGEKELLTALAGQVGIAIGQADLYQQATENAIRARQQAADLKATLAALQRTQSQLVQTEKMSSLGQLVAGVAHEINNPVSFIDGNVFHAAAYAQDLLTLVERYQATYPTPPTALADLIEEIDLDFLAADFPRLLESMQVGAERIKNIVASLRTFSRMDEAEIKAVNLHDGLESTIMILQHRLKANGDRPQIFLKRNYGDLPMVECYAGKLNQVFMNLLSNAIDALEEQIRKGNQSAPPTITVETAVLPDQEIYIAIADNGAGIPESKRHRIFEPFYTTKPIGKGTGIGLSISYQIITEHHHGSLNCDSQTGQGTTFHIKIPLRQASSQRALTTE